MLTWYAMILTNVNHGRTWRAPEPFHNESRNESYRIFLGASALFLNLALQVAKKQAKEPNIQPYIES